MEKVEASLIELIKRMSKGIPLFILCALIGGGLNYYRHAKSLVTYYTAKATLFAVCNGDADALKAGVNNITLSNQLMPTYFQVIRTDDFLGKVIQEAKIDYSISKVKQMIGTSSVENTPIFKIYVRGTNEKDIAAIMEAILKLGPQEIYDVIKIGYFKEIDHTKLPLTPENQSLKRPFVVGCILGGALPAIIFMCVILMDTSVRSEEQLEYYYKLTVLASIPKIKSK